MGFYGRGILVTQKHAYETLGLATVGAKVSRAGSEPLQMIAQIALSTVPNVDLWDSSFH